MHRRMVWRSASERVKAFLQKGLGILIHRTSAGPWRSKSVLAAVIFVVIGAGVWVSDFKSNSVPARTESNRINVPPTASPSTGREQVEMQPDRRSFPFYVPIAASYAVGYCIGWLFRRFIRLVAGFTALLIALLALGRYAGCDTAPVQERVHQTGEWAQHELTATRDYLLHLLPSAAADGAGTCLGFRRRDKMAAPDTPETSA